MQWRLYGPFVDDVGVSQVRIVHEEGMTIRDALEGLFAVAPQIRERVLDADGDLAEFVHVVHNHVDVFHELAGLDTPVAAGDQLALFHVPRA